jgi:hypothetical protein
VANDHDLDLFQELIEQRYPGSKQTRKMLTDRLAERSAQDDEVAPWDAKPRMLTVNGVEHEFFTIGDLALALGRKPVTIRAWEANGIFPKARYKKGRVKGKQLRLYTRAQIEGVVRIAREEGILNMHKSMGFEATNFTTRVLELWRETALS